MKGNRARGHFQKQHAVGVQSERAEPLLPRHKSFRRLVSFIGFALPPTLHRTSENRIRVQSPRGRKGEEEKKEGKEGEKRGGNPQILPFC
jgi:hypothetical protein